MARPKNPALRARILEAAALEFSERGFGGASMDSIGGRAGGTKGGVYMHFRTKEELFFAVLDEWSDGLKAALRDDPAGASGADEARAVLAVFLDYHFRTPQAAGLLRLLATEMRGRFTAQLREDLGGALRALRARLREVLTEGARDASLFATDPAQAAFVLAAGAEGVVQQWLAAPRDVEPFCDAEALAEAMVVPYATDLQAGETPAPDATLGGDLSPPF